MKDRVLKLVEKLQSTNSTNDIKAVEEGAKMSKEQRALRAKELAQGRMDLVNALQALVPVYTETVLAYSRAFQELAVSVEAVCCLCC